MDYLDVKLDDLRLFVSRLPVDGASIPTYRFRPKIDYSLAFDKTKYCYAPPQPKPDHGCVFDKLYKIIDVPTNEIKTDDYIYTILVTLQQHPELYKYILNYCCRMIIYCNLSVNSQEEATILIYSLLKEFHHQNIGPAAICG